MSPCISVCKISQQTGLCEGCFRSLDEIARWAQMTDLQRESVMRQLPARTGKVSVTSQASAQIRR